VGAGFRKVTKAAPRPSLCRLDSLEGSVVISPFSIGRLVGAPLLPVFVRIHEVCREFLGISEMILVQHARMLRKGLPHRWSDLAVVGRSDLLPQDLLRLHEPFVQPPLLLELLVLLLLLLQSLNRA